MPGSPKCSLSLRFPYQNPVYASPLPIRTTCPAHLIILVSTKHINKVQNTLIKYEGKMFNIWRRLKWPVVFKELKMYLYVCSHTLRAATWLAEICWCLPCNKITFIRPSASVDLFFAVIHLINARNINIIKLHYYVYVSPYICTY